MRANIADRDGAKLLLAKLSEGLPRMEKVWADRGYNGKIGEWIKERLGWALEIVKPPRRWVRVPADEEPPPYPAGFIVLPRRWVSRAQTTGLSKTPDDRDYEYLCETTEALIYVAMIRLMLRRLVKPVPTKRRKRPQRAIFWCLVLPKSHHRGFFNYFSYSLARWIPRSSPDSGRRLPTREHHKASAVGIVSPSAPLTSIHSPGCIKF